MMTFENTLIKSSGDSSLLFILKAFLLTVWHLQLHNQKHHC